MIFQQTYEKLKNILRLFENGPLVSKHNEKQYDVQQRWIITERLLRCQSRLDEVEPEDNLTQLYVDRVTQTDDDDVDAAGVADEQVVGHVIRLVARELPYTYLTNTWTAQHCHDSEHSHHWHIKQCSMLYLDCK